MSDKCGNCDCSHSTQCMKKGYTMDFIDTERSFIETIVMDVPAAEHDGKCMCGSSCSCTPCTCCH